MHIHGTKLCSLLQIFECKVAACQFKITIDLVDLLKIYTCVIESKTQLHVYI